MWYCSVTPGPLAFAFSTQDAGFLWTLAAWRRLLLGYFSLRPVCIPLTEEDLRSFNVPIEQRTDRDFYLKVFKNKDGEWSQCRTWLSRFFFFQPRVARSHFS